MSTVDKIKNEIEIILENSFSQFSNKIKLIIQNELAKIAQQIHSIVLMRLDRTIDQNEFQTMLDVEKYTAEVALYSVKGISEVVTQQAINQALTQAILLVIKLV